jgi:hypothetical protein
MQTLGSSNSKIKLKHRVLKHTTKEDLQKHLMSHSVKDLDVENALWEDISSAIKELKEHQLLTQQLLLSQDVAQILLHAQISLTQTNGIAQPAIPIRYLLNKLVHL